MQYLLAIPRERVLVWAIRVGVLGILLAPFVVSGLTVFPNIFVKVIYFRVLAAVVFVLYLFLLLKNRSYLPRLSPVFVSVLLFIEMLLLSTFRGINPERGFFGTMERMEGFILFAHLFLFFIVLVGVFRTKREWIYLLSFLLLASIPMGVIGLLQKFAHLGLYFSNPGDPRVGSVFGNPIFYATWLTFIIFLALFLAVYLRGQKTELPRFFQNHSWKLFGFLAAFNLLMLLFTGTRGSWIGVGTGAAFLFVSGVFVLRKGERAKEQRRALLFGVFLVLLFFLFFLLFARLGYFEDSFFLDRYEDWWAQLMDPGSDSRVLVWELGLKAWKDSPLLGYGPESFSYVYDTYYNVNLLKDIPELVFFDRAHSKIIDILTAQGLLGLAGYMGMFGAALYMIRRHWKRNFSSSLALLVAALLVAYFTQNLFTFDMLGSYILFFFTFAFIDVLFREDGRNQVSSTVSPTNGWAKPGFAHKIALGAICAAVVLIGWSIWEWNIRALETSIHITAAHKDFGEGKADSGFYHGEKAFEAPSFLRHETAYYVSEIVFGAARLDSNQEKQTQERFSAKLREAAERLEETTKKEKPEVLHMRSYLFLAQIYQYLHIVSGDSQYLEREESILGEALRLNPGFPHAYRLAGKMRFTQGRDEEGLIFYSKAHELDHDAAKFYEWWGNSLAETGQNAKAAEALRKSLIVGDFYAKGNFDLSLIWRIADLYERNKNYYAMAGFYEEVIRRQPNEKPDPQLYASLSTVYRILHNNERVKELTEELIDYYPEFREKAEEFLSTLENDKMIK